jgi:formylglycine-generating enzyme required for sulfatase activity
MMFRTAMVRGALAAMLACWTVVAQAAVTIDTVFVGDPGNVGEGSGGGYGGSGPDRICGAVGYSYNIGQYEVAAGQYTAFLNAVGGVDTYSLYDSRMSSTVEGCQVQRTVSLGRYVYTVASDYEKRPVNFVSWGDSARFANWLHNGQPTGSQSSLTTEDGAYELNGAKTAAELLAVSRKVDWKWALTSEDEWYKAAYHDKAAGLAATYFDYPTGSNSVPGRDMADTSGNNANYFSSSNLLGSLYYRTEFGEFQLSDSSYGTFDQGGNISEWNEAIPTGSTRGFRGGSYALPKDSLKASVRGSMEPTSASNAVGFRVVHVPEPGSAAMLAVISWTAFVYWRRKRPKRS